MCGSKYTGYLFSLRYDGDLVDGSQRAPDGTCLNGIAAIDALDGRYIRPFTLETQMQTENMLRELNKAAAGFATPLGSCQLPPYEQCVVRVRVCVHVRPAPCALRVLLHAEKQHPPTHPTNNPPTNACTTQDGMLTSGCCNELTNSAFVCDAL